MARKTLIGIGLVLGLLRTGVAANLDRVTPGCLEEVQNVCHASGQELDLCLQTKGSEFSQECRRQYWESNVYMQDQQGPGACATDLQALCPGTSVRKIQKCLVQKMQEMPDRCRAFLFSNHTS